MFGLTIPKLSAPLTKSIRTAEGILVWGVNVAIGIASAIPSAHLSVQEAGILATVNTGLLVGQRTILKGTAILKDLGAPAIPFNPPAAVTNVVNAVEKEVPVVIPQVEAEVAKPSISAAIADVVSDAEEVTAQPPVPTPAA